MPLEPIRTLLSNIYGVQTGEEVMQELQPILDGYRGRIPMPPRSGLSERDAILITYPDQVQTPDQPPLVTLADFCNNHLADLISGIHILPFFPWSSDDGFSVMDYEAVAPQYGTWDNVRRLGEHFRLMFDAVINHVSAEGAWFKAYLADDPDFRDFFIEVTGSPDLSAVVRPRALPLLSEFKGSRGPVKLWTTFSADQMDLNYHNPRVLLRIVEAVLFYASQGAQFLRLDAIAYLWKEPGTPCINLPQTHWIVQLLRCVLDQVAPHVMLITETNVPNLQNLSYFGDGSNEAQLVYNFPLPPLVLHAMQAGTASALTRWAARLQLPSSKVTFLNFLASHDGIGLNPVRGILPESEIRAMANRIAGHGGFVSNKSNPDGTQSPYELNVNYFDALNAADLLVDSSMQVERFVTSHAILLAFQGIPAIYFHSMFGSRGWPEGVKQTQKYRSINREKLQRTKLEHDLAKRDSLRAQIFDKVSRLLEVRGREPCFSPHASQRVLDGPAGCFILLREGPSDGACVLCLHNVTNERQQAALDVAGTALAGAPRIRDLITGKVLPGGDQITVELAAYESVWLTNRI